jgi:hypothetical protein
VGKLIGFFRTHGKNWFEAFHIVYAAIVIAGGVAIIFAPTGSEDAPWRARFILVAFLASFILLLGSTLYLSFSLGRKARYAAASEHFHDVMHIQRDTCHQLQQLIRNMRANNLQELEFKEATNLKHFRILLSAVANYFSLVTGCACRAMIYVFDSDTQTSVPQSGVNIGQTIASRIHILKLRLLAINSVASTTVPVDVRQQIWLRDDAVFTDMCLGRKGLHANPKANGSGKSGSDIRVPIRYIPSDQRDSPQLQEKLSIPGFLVIESSSRKSFDMRFDGPYAAAISDALYPLLVHLFEALELKYMSSANPKQSHIPDRPMSSNAL